MSDLTRRRIVVGLALAAAVLCFAPLDAVGLRSRYAPYASFVLVDRWEDRASDDGLRSLGPAAVEWSKMRANGNKVYNVDADSSEAKSYESYLKNTTPPLFIAFDGDKYHSQTNVKSIADAARAYKIVTGKSLQ